MPTWAITLLVVLALAAVGAAVYFWFNQDGGTKDTKKFANLGDYLSALSPGVSAP